MAPTDFCSHLPFTIMAGIQHRFVSTIQSILHISDTGPGLDQFVADWQTLFTDLEQQSDGLFEDRSGDLADSFSATIDALRETLDQLSLEGQSADDASQPPSIPPSLLAFGVADAIQARCETLLELDKADHLLFERLHTSNEAAKAKLVQLERDSPSPSPPATSPVPFTQQPLHPSENTEHVCSHQEEIYTASDAPTASPSPQPTLSSRVQVPPPLTTVESEIEPTGVAGPSSPSASSRSPSPSTDTLPPTPTTPTPSPTYIQPILEHFVANPYNPYPHKSFLTHVASSTSTSEKDVNTYFRSLRSKLGWNRIQKRYFPKPHWTQWQMIAWLEGLWRFEHSREPSFDEWDKYRGPAGLGGKMKGLDAELVVIVHELKSMAERRQGPTEVAKVLDQVDWEEFAEKKNLKRKAEEDEASWRRVVSEPTHKRARSESEEAQSKKRSRSESPESDDGTPPPSKRHCSLPTMSLSTPPELTHWKTSAWVPPAQVSLNTFNYDRYAVPVLVDDESEDGSECGSSGREYPFSFLLVSVCPTLCCCGGKEWMNLCLRGFIFLLCILRAFLVSN
ncbi:hypothetical protein CPB85DRAFT_18867 [Mucidula mucida]|nr:hypothetical protein CPB85DRAFT_18867 [Mucidula mucida]